MDYLYNDYKTDYKPFFQIDSKGYLLPPIQKIEDIPSYNRTILERLIKLCEERVGRDLVSIYFRGSQLLDSFSSDFDTVIVTSDDDVKWSSLGAIFYQELNESFPHIKVYDTLAISRNKLMEDRNYQFIIKVLGLRVFGEDLEKSIRGFKVNKEIIFLIPKIESKLQKVKFFLHAKPKAREIRSIANYFVKFLMRCSFELVLCEFNKYTRDIYVCNSVFNDYYPQYKNLSIRVLNYFNKNTIDIKEFVEDCDAFCEIIINEYRTLDNQIWQRNSY